MSDARPELSAATLLKQRRPAILVTGACARHGRLPDAFVWYKTFPCEEHTALYGDTLYGATLNFLPLHDSLGS